MRFTQSRTKSLFPSSLLPDSDLNRRAKAIWDFEGINCSSRHIPGVKFAGLIHPGILGCAPSAEVLKTWNEREAGLIKACSHMDRDVALPPEPKNIHAGSAGADIKEKIGKEGARTVPGRPEHGGNCDIKNLSRGSKVYLPVHVKGAKFSVGDLHFSQGDGEISFCGAIEMAGVITINFSVMKGGMKELAMKSQSTSRDLSSRSSVLDDTSTSRASVWTSMASSTTLTRLLRIARLV